LQKGISMKHIILKEDVEPKQACDWIIHYVPYSDHIDAHTHGLSRKHDHPELQITLPVNMELVKYVINTMGIAVSNGKKFSDGDEIFGLFENQDLPVRLIARKATGENVLRIVLPDKNSKFPDDKDCLEYYRDQFTVYEE